MVHRFLYPHPLSLLFLFFPFLPHSHSSSNFPLSRQPPPSFLPFVLSIVLILRPSEQSHSAPSRALSRTTPLTVPSSSLPSAGANNSVVRRLRALRSLIGRMIWKPSIIRFLRTSKKVCRFSFRFLRLFFSL